VSHDAAELDFNNLPFETISADRVMGKGYASSFEQSRGSSSMEAFPGDDPAKSNAGATPRFASGRRFLKHGFE